MRWCFMRVGAMVALGLGLVVADRAAAGAGFVPQPMGKELIMVKLDAPVWLQCRFEAGQFAEVPEFCARLRADFQRQSGQALADESTPPEGARVLVVSVALRDSHRAMVTLAAGRQGADGFVPQTTQELRLGGADAPLRAGSAAALVYPLAGLLETLR